jgi:hypothetical protein
MYRTLTVEGRKYRVTTSSDGHIAVVRDLTTQSNIGYLFPSGNGWKQRDGVVWFKTVAQAAKSLILHRIFNTEGINWSIIS